MHMPHAAPRVIAGAVALVHQLDKKNFEYQRNLSLLNEPTNNICDSQSVFTHAVYLVY
jgi:hypothetical protein